MVFATVWFSHIFVWFLRKLRLNYRFSPLAPERWEMLTCYPRHWKLTEGTCEGKSPTDHVPSEKKPQLIGIFLQMDIFIGKWSINGGLSNHIWWHRRVRTSKSLQISDDLNIVWAMLVHRQLCQTSLVFFFCNLKLAELRLRHPGLLRRQCKAVQWRPLVTSTFWDQHSSCGEKSMRPRHIMVTSTMPNSLGEGCISLVLKPDILDNDWVFTNGNWCLTAQHVDQLLSIYHITRNHSWQSMGHNGSEFILSLLAMNSMVWQCIQHSPIWFKSTSPIGWWRKGNGKVSFEQPVLKWLWTSTRMKANDMSPFCSLCGICAFGLPSEQQARPVCLPWNQALSGAMISLL